MKVCSDRLSNEEHDMILTHWDLDIGISEWKTVIKQMDRRNRSNTLRDNDWDWIDRTEQTKIVDGHPNVSILLPIWSYHDC